MKEIGDILRGEAEVEVYVHHTDNNDHKEEFASN